MTITVKKFIELLQVENPEHELYFEGLDFYRLKDRGGCVQVEFNQTVFKDGDDVIVINHKVDDK